MGATKLPDDLVTNRIHFDQARPSSPESIVEDQNVAIVEEARMVLPEKILRSPAPPHGALFIVDNSDQAELSKGDKIGADQPDAALPRLLPYVPAADATRLAARAVAPSAGCGRQRFDR